MGVQSSIRIRYVKLYTIFVSFLGIVLVVLAIKNLSEDWLGLLLFAGLAALSELSSVELFISSRQSRVSISSIIAIASIVLFGPLGGVLTHAASGITTMITTTILSRLPEEGRASWFQRTLFNVGMLVVAAAIAGWVYVQLGGTPGYVNRASNIIPIIGAASADTIANLAILIGIITLQTGRSPLDTWKQDFQWAAPIAIIGGAVGGGVLALAYEMFEILGLAVFLLPILAMSYSFRLYANNMRGYINKLEDANISLEESNLGLLETIGAIIDAYDVYTYGHSTQVAAYALEIAKEMDLSADLQNIIVKASLVHDIGKVGVLDTIISKPGSLTEEEYKLIKQHPSIGADILSRMEGFKEILPIVRHHHERWDGKGYPDGLEGEMIPIGARVLAVADSVDAMLSDRPYRPTRSLMEVTEEVKRCTGANYDPVVAKAFIAVTEKKDSSFFKNSANTVDQTLQRNGELAGDIGNRYLKKSMLPEYQVKSG